MALLQKERRTCLKELTESLKIIDKIERNRSIIYSYYKDNIEVLENDIIEKSILHVQQLLKYYKRYGVEEIEKKTIPVLIYELLYNLSLYADLTGNKKYDELIKEMSRFPEIHCRYFEVEYLSMRRELIRRGVRFEENKEKVVFNSMDDVLLQIRKDFYLLIGKEFVEEMVINPDEEDVEFDEYLQERFTEVYGHKIRENLNKIIKDDLRENSYLTDFKKERYSKLFDDLAEPIDHLSLLRLYIQVLKEILCTCKLGYQLSDDIEKELSLIHVHFLILSEFPTENIHGYYLSMQILSRISLRLYLDKRKKSMKGYVEYLDLVGVCIEKVDQFKDFISYVNHSPFSR